MSIDTDKTGEVLRCDTWAEYQEVQPDDRAAALLVPEHDELGPPYPGGILPGYYTRAGRLALVTEHFESVHALRFIADMTE